MGNASCLRIGMVQVSGRRCARVCAQVRAHVHMCVHEHENACSDSWSESSPLCCLRGKSVGAMCRGRQMCLDVAQGLFYLHSNSVVHLDIKACPFSNSLQSSD